MGAAVSPFVLASISVFLYTFLFIVSFYYFWTLQSLKQAHSICPKHGIRGRYDDTKIIFFGTLAISSFLDIPLFVGCLLEGGPTDCEWEDPAYPVLWCLHLIALCGYAFSTSIPSVLWSDIIKQKDGKLFNSQSPPDFIKLFFKGAIFLYALLEVITCVVVAASFDAYNSDVFYSTVFYEVSTACEPLILLSVAGVCLFCGINLQIHLFRVQFYTQDLFKVLFKINFVMFILTTTQILRAFLVLTLVTRMYGDSVVPVNYGTWLLGTRWFPHIFCSLFLANEMRQSTRNNAQNSEYACLDVSTSSVVFPINGDEISDRESSNAEDFGNRKSDLEWSFSGSALMGGLWWRGSQSSAHSSESSLSTQYLVLNSAFDDHQRMPSVTLRDASFDRRLT